MKGILWNRGFRAIQVTVYKVYFKQMLTNNARAWASAERNRSKIQTMDMTFFRSARGKTRRSSTGN
jgi:hypothetical protein